MGFILIRTQDDIETGITGQQHIERMVNKSLANLGMDYVDLYIYHSVICLRLRHDSAFAGMAV